MIVTKSWLNEWINLENISTEVLCKTFNAIGLEVDRVESCRIPAKIVIGKVIECEKHPDADKLNVCKVDLGSSIRQIVCGAANVREGLYVPVATIGAQMPGGLVIKPVQLRGVDSEGMICSSTEIGLPKLADGILELDESIGKLKLGSELSTNPYFNDDLIEIELTANRGDCLSIYGVARDLSAALNRPLKELARENDEERRLGIGRVLHLSHSDIADVALQYRAIEYKHASLPLLTQLRLAQIEEQKPTTIESLLFYATYGSGVVLRAYRADAFEKNEAGKYNVGVRYDDNGFAAIYGKQKASTIGVIQNDDSRAPEEDMLLFIEASYIAPEIVSRKMFETKCESGPLYYRTSRGSEPDLQIGLSYALNMIEQLSESGVYGGCIEYGGNYEARLVSITVDEVNAFIGATIEKGVVVQILGNLGFNMSKSQDETFVVSVPRFRHDIVNKQDLVEEIVRMVGIDNIPSKPFVFAEANRLDDDYAQYKKRRTYRQRAAQSGFFESVHFVFNQRESLAKYGFVCVDKSKELLNPIVNTLDTLRPTLLLNLIESASRNMKVGRKRVTLFELGSVFGPQREESFKLAFVHAGAQERESFDNAGKPEPVSFGNFVQSVSDVIGNVELTQTTTTHALANPYQCAAVMQEGEKIGELFKLHPDVQADYDLDATYLCEIDVSKLQFSLKEAKPFSKFQSSFRDLSVLMPETMAYVKVKAVIEAALSGEIIRFYPIDRYSDASLGDQVSMTLRFVLQSTEKTLEEEDITNAMSGVLGALERELGLTLR